MQGKKLSIIIIIAVVVAAGWYLSIKAFSRVDIIKEQNILVEQADYYAEKKLYVRAIPLYKQALEYDTEQIAEIQKKLLNTYIKYEDIYEYVKLAESRIQKNTAEEEEYIAVADYYLSSRHIEDAMQIIKKGIEQLNSNTLKKYYEDNRYTYDVKITHYQHITPTVENKLMPAFDGEKWVYVDEAGRDIQIGSFDTAVPFNSDGYAIVSIDGKYRTILENGDLYGIDELGVEDVYALSNSRVLDKYKGKYSYYNYDFESLTQGTHQYVSITSNNNGVAAVQSDKGWGVITDSGETVVDFGLSDVAANSLGTAFMGNHAMVKGSQGWYLIDTQGNALTEIYYADAKAPESAQGYIAVSNSSGKWGFVNLAGELVIDYQYDDAKSFSNGVAAVCLGDRWEYISTENKTVIDLSLDRAEPFHGGRAQAHFPDGTILIELDYYEE